MEELEAGVKTVDIDDSGDAGESADEVLDIMNSLGPLHYLREPRKGGREEPLVGERLEPLDLTLVVHQPGDEGRELVLTLSDHPRGLRRVAPEHDREAGEEQSEELDPRLE